MYAAVQVGVDNSVPVGQILVHVQEGLGAGNTGVVYQDIQLAEGCALKKVVIDGETWYQVVKA